KGKIQSILNLLKQGERTSDKEIQNLLIKITELLSDDPIAQSEWLKTVFDTFSDTNINQNSTTQANLKIKKFYLAFGKEQRTLSLTTINYFFDHLMKYLALAPLKY
ncbi:MAG: hypothetical protein HY843_02975, partial [Bdellovibrio sp.]|nr:hypothetical protein [Bdellovibrio sp.]